MPLRISCRLSSPTKLLLVFLLGIVLPVVAARAAALGPDTELTTDIVPSGADQPDAFLPRARSLGKLEVARPALQQLSENLRALADGIKTFHEAGAPIEHGLEHRKSGVPDTYGHLTDIHDFVSAIDKDLGRSQSGSYTVLSSHTLEQAYRFALGWVTDSENLKALRNSGVVGEAFARRLGYLSFGADDMIPGIGRMIGSRRHDDIEGVTMLLNGINKTAWGALGYVVALPLVKGDIKAAREIAAVFQGFGSLAADFGRWATAPVFMRAVSKFKGVDRALISAYEQAQEARIAHDLSAQSIEDFYGHDANLLGKLSWAQRRNANAQFNFSTPREIVPSRQKTVATRRSYASYQEICSGGFCTRTDLSSINKFGASIPEQVPVAIPDDVAQNVGGVWATPKPSDLAKPANGSSPLDVDLNAQKLGTERSLTPLNQLRPQDLALATDMARLSQLAYERGAIEPFGSKENGQWRRVELVAKWSGLDLSVFERTTPDGKTTRVLAFAGTEDLRDWISNIVQGRHHIGLPNNASAQYRHAMEIVKKHVQEADGRSDLQLIVTGHSLAGSLAQYASLHYGLRAFVFDAAPLQRGSVVENDYTLFKGITRQKIELAKTNITNFFLYGEPVHELPGTQLGRQIQIKPKPGLPGIRENYTGGFTLDAIKRHDMGAFLASLVHARRSIRLRSLDQAPQPSLVDVPANPRSDPKKTGGVVINATPEAIGAAPTGMVDHILNQRPTGDGAAWKLNN